MFVFNIFILTEVKYNMQVNSVNKDNFRNIYNKNNVSFEGFNIKAFIPKKNIRTEKAQQVIDDACWRFGNVIGVKTSDLKQLTQNADDIRMQFLKSLVTNYNARNFTRAGNLKEDPIGLINTFKAVEKPLMAHFNIVKRTDAPLELLSKLFKTATDKQSLEFVQKMQHEVLGGQKTAIKIITDMLASKNKQEYIKNSENYISYLKHNAKNEDAIKKLDKMLENGTYEKQVFDAKQAVEAFMKNSVLKVTLGNRTKYLEQNYSPEGEKFIKGMFSDFLAHKKDLTVDDFSDILKMYKTSTPENINTRLDILRKFKYASIGKNLKYSSQEIKSMKKLFDRMDSDKSSANFVFKILGDDIKAKSIKDLEGILDVVPSKKAEIFHKNISRIVRYTDEEERVAALKNEVENPFFMTDRYAKVLEDSINAGFSKRESRISKMARFLENKYNQMRYNRIESVQTLPTVEIPMEKPLSIIPVDELSEVVGGTDHPVIELKRTFKESPQARKLRVQNDVNEIIKQKLGVKTFERQQEAYKNGALVMRLKLLPEIFASIKDTRKAQKLADYRPNVENADAIKLYSRINGKNKKLVNYMLKQTDSHGDRVYNVKDILKTLDLIECKISNLKAVKGKDFRAEDSKRICELEYEIVSSQYGKLRHVKTVA